jgi:2-polyprenyl-3-methyl-5-hydroxy-6-metoxy-1,4-benzoquinol methylase
MQRESSSFRDPAGYIYKSDNGTILRVISNYGKSDFDALEKSGLYKELTDEGLLVEHKDVSSGYKSKLGADVYKVIEPEQLPLISYPYEWSYSQYKDAALTTLEVHRRALEKGLSLKDSSAYNIQFFEGKPIFIDTLSFEPYKEGEPWVAYRQFCQHFLAPLALMAYKDVELNKLMSIYIDGVPLGLASKLLPKKAKLKPGILAHIALHARSQAKHESAEKSSVAKLKKATISKSRQLSLIQNLANTIKALPMSKKNTEWGEYYTFTNYSKKSFKQKEKMVHDMAKKVKPKTVWDLGANDGSFSRVVATLGAQVASFDIDPNAVEKNYQVVKRNNEANLLPLLLDLTNPSPAIGWSSSERQSFIQRGPADLVMSLALIHHLSISNNVPLPELSKFFAEISKYLIMEFVPKQDSKVQKLLSSRKDIFSSYNEEGFEAAFSEHFKIIDKKKVSGSKRTLYLLRRK